VHHPLTERVGGRDLRAFGDQTQRLRDTDQPRQPLRATGAREQTDLHLREADAGLRLVGIGINWCRLLFFISLYFMPSTLL
jgi:hypothetical protein